MTNTKKSDLGEKLYQWYHENARDLPWRHTKDPYKIWLSEIMLQQTQVVTVIAYYEKFTKAFPTVKHMAEASVDDVLALWQGLGYYARARNMKKCADEIVNKHDGKFPNSYLALLNLPGIGPYTAGAIASIAFGERVPAVDGNVQRVLSRCFELPYDLSDSKSIKAFQRILMPLIPEDPSSFTQALMDLGATICTPKAPVCDICPLQRDCLAHTNHSELKFPIKTKKIQKKSINMSMALVRYENKILIYKQTADRLLQGMWALPSFADQADGFELKESVEREFMLKLSKGPKIGSVKHVFTHLIWHIDLYYFEADNPYEIDYPEVSWALWHSLETYALPTVVKKALACVEHTKIYNLLNDDLIK